MRQQTNCLDRPLQPESHTSTTGGAAAPREWVRKPSPSHPQSSSTTMPMPAAIQKVQNRKQDHPPDMVEVVTIHDDGPLPGGDKLKSSAKKPQVFTLE